MSMKVNFYYVRHGQTLFNRLGRMQGMCDSPLTEKGVEIIDTPEGTRFRTLV